MIMTDNEIVREYSAAKRKKEQIKILADLNVCKYNDIVDILQKYGINEERRGRKKVGEEKEHEMEAVKEPIKEMESKAAVEPEMERIKIMPIMPSTITRILTKRMIACQNAIDKNKKELKEINDFMGGFQNEPIQSKEKSN